MTLAPLLYAGPVIIGHVGAAFAALGLGIAQLIRRKGTSSHRAIGWVWVALMGIVAAGSFAIHQIRQLGPFSLIHLLSAFTLVMLVFAVVQAHRGNIEAHMWTMISLFVFALVLTGAFTLLPGRIMHQVVFGG